MIRSFLSRRVHYLTSFGRTRHASYQRPPPLTKPPHKHEDYQHRASFTEKLISLIERKIPIRSRRFWMITGGCSTVGTVYYVSHLESAPITGRRQFIDISKTAELEMGEKAYIELLEEYKGRFLPSYHPIVKRVRDVGMRIVEQTNLTGLNWKFHVVDSPEANAFVIPGGKVFVFSGILPILENDDGLAAVLGHEIAHQVARHSAEKVSFSKIFSLISFLIMLATGQEYHHLESMALNLLMNLPFSRKCESEADYIGLLLMSKACFRSEEAVEVWKRMSAQDKMHVPGFLSTHPSHPKRIQTIVQWMPEANIAREGAECASFHQFSSASRRVPAYV